MSLRPEIVSRHWCRFALLLACAAASVLAVSGASSSGSLRSRDAIVARAGWIKVGLKRGVSSCRVTVPGPFRVLSSAGAIGQSASGAILEASGASGGMSLVLAGQKLPQATAVAIEPADPSQGGYFEISSGKYRGRLLLVQRGQNIDLINQLQIDDWLKGVLPAEIGPSHMEALKAQAVAGRSEAVHKLYKPPHASEGFDFCTGQHCQVYKGMSAETPDSVMACDSTLGYVLFAGNDVMDAVYHDLCGGITAAAEDVWNPDSEPGLMAIYDVAGPPKTIDLPDDQGVRLLLSTPLPEVFCNPDRPGFPEYAKKYYRWQKTYDAALLQSIGGVGKVRNIMVSQRCNSGRVRKLRIDGDRGSRTIERELPIREAFDLWSGLFVVDVQKEGEYVRSATFSGAGHGHGVGLCQMGARSMALSGFTCEQILAHYYMGAKLVQIYKR